jgi:aspartyl-tRNA(Asn)/glutamyl-tRNA(Gln) amidotransferase subunit C
MSTIDLRHVARLARLHLSDEELRFFQTQVSQILSFVEKLNEVKGLENVPPTSHPFSLSDVFRDDQIKPSLVIEEFLKRSPQSQGRFFKVPKIIENKT